MELVENLPDCVWNNQHQNSANYFSNDSNSEESTMSENLDLAEAFFGPSLQFHVGNTSTGGYFSDQQQETFRSPATTLEMNITSLCSVNSHDHLAENLGSSSSEPHLRVENSINTKKPRLEKQHRTSKRASRQETNDDVDMIMRFKEMTYWVATMRPVRLVASEAMEKPKRRNVRISSDPQTAAARQRRERISERLRVLQRLVPGGSKMDTATMLDEAANYLRFLKSQVGVMENQSGIVSRITASPNQSFPMKNNS